MFAIPRQSVNLSGNEFKAICKSIISGCIFAGPQIKEFELRFAEYIGVKYALAVSSGRAAQYLVLAALNLDAGSEVIIPSYTFYIVPVVVKILGLKPVFVDVRPDTFNLDYDYLEERITSRTKCIILTHIAGQSCDIEKILVIAKKYNLYVLEDCAEACGAEYKGRKVGSFVDASYYSFHISKSLTCLGGGMVTTNDEQILKRMQKILSESKVVSKTYMFQNITYALIAYLFTRPFIFTFLAYPLIVLSHLSGLNFIDKMFTEKISLFRAELEKSLAKMSNLQAGVGLQQLFRLEEMNSRRIKNSMILYEFLKDCKGVHIQKLSTQLKNTYLFFFMGIPDREKIRKKLAFYGIDTRSDVLSACHKIDIFKEKENACPVAEQLASYNIILPNYPSLKEKDMQKMAKRIEKTLKNNC